jgi:Nif-specific regulatory protein
MADGGTLFLDEIGEISTSFQAKLLRVLQEGEFERVGGNHTIKVDVRLVTATNRNLEAAVISGDFRSDLYYRVSVVPIFLPPLRERREDVPLLAREFLKRFNKEHGVTLSISPHAMEVLTAYDYPGNVRELESCVRRTAALTKTPMLQAEDFSLGNESSSMGLDKSMSGKRLAGGGTRVFPALTSNGAEWTAAQPGRGVREEAQSAEAAGEGEFSERERLVDAMERAGWVQAKAARLLTLTPRQMGYALRKHGIEIKRF